MAARETADASPVLEAFTLNEEASFYRAVVTDRHPAQLSWEGSERAAAVILHLERDPNDFQMVWRRTLSADLDSIIETMMGPDTPARADLISRIHPVFDATLVNNGLGVAVLTGLEVEVLEAYVDSGDGGEAPLLFPAPVAVLHRYKIPLPDPASFRHTIKSSAVPPIEVPPERAARIQVQLLMPFPAANYTLRIYFRFNDGALVQTATFRVSSGWGLPE